MFTSQSTIALTAFLSLASAATQSVTPHDMFSSSIGVLGCKINTNRAAYFPKMPGCDNMCYKVTANGRSVNLLHVDQSGGAWDISYDAWNYLTTGEGAKAHPTAGGGVNMEVDVVSMDQCKDLITTDDKKLGFLALSPNFVNACKASSPNSYPAKNFQLWNYVNQCCSLGADKKCDLDPATQGPSQQCQGTTLGLQTPVKTNVMNIMYMTGKEVPCA